MTFKEPPLAAIGRGDEVEVDSVDSTGSLRCMLSAFEIGAGRDVKDEVDTVD